MYITTRTLRAIALSTLSLSAAQAKHVVDSLSFGHKEGGVSPNLRGIPHWSTVGHDYTPEILSDRVLLTPPYPGNKRGALWSDEPLNHEDFSAELWFRASGQERGSGNLQIWYTKDNQKNSFPSSLYTSPKFDGLAILIDQYEGRGGSVRGFLNDGSIEFKNHHDPDTLSFGQCNFAYRNRGILSAIKVRHADGIFEVTIDGNPCFRTDKVKLPTGYYFGITAASAENPDSFEVHKFIVTTDIANKRDKSNYNPGQNQQPISNQVPNQNKPPNLDHSSNHKPEDIPKMLADVQAGLIRSQEDQFADLHNRLQIVSHYVDDIWRQLDQLEVDSKQRFESIMNKIAAHEDRQNAALRNVEKIERISMEIQRDLQSKDFKEVLNAVHRSIQDSHSAMQQSMPQAMAHIVGTNRPSLYTFAFIAIAVQIMVVGAYLVYKKRRHGAPKKYL